MDWFERLTGFREEDYEQTRGKLRIEGNRLLSLVNGNSYGIGDLELVSLADLRARVASDDRGRGRLAVKNITSDIRALHRDPDYAGALFQVASQFNLLEMASPRYTPEHGVGVYERDHTQGPACAIAAGAATIYRNYFAPVNGIPGQTRQRQLDGLEHLGWELARRLQTTVDQLWTMENGYALCTDAGLAKVRALLLRIGEDERDALRGLLRIGVHSRVEVTDAPSGAAQFVTQAFCSALPVAYGDAFDIYWEAFAILVLEAAYEATMLAAVLNGRQGGSRTVLLTRLGGGAFGNEPDWIDAAMQRALRLARDFDLNVILVNHGPPDRRMLAIEQEFR